MGSGDTFKNLYSAFRQIRGWQRVFLYQLLLAQKTTYAKVAYFGGGKFCYPSVDTRAWANISSDRIGMKLLVADS